MTTDKWEDFHKLVGRVFTGGNDGDDDYVIKLDRYVDVGKR